MEVREERRARAISGEGRVHDDKVKEEAEATEWEDARGRELLDDAHVPQSIANGTGTKLDAGG